MDKEQGVRWKEFEVKDIFETMPFKNGLQVPTGALVSANHLEMGSTPRITVTSDNNGIGGYYKDFDDKNYRVYENCISVSFLGTVFYHPYKASFDMKVHCLKPKNHVLSECEALFILPIIRRKLHSNDYFNQTKSTDLPYMKLFLPATTDDTPDWDYMAERIKELEAERIKKLEAYLLASGLDDYELTEADKQVLVEEVQWKEFRLGDLFDKATVKGVPKSAIPDMLAYRDDVLGHPVYGQNIKWQYPYKVVLPECYLRRLDEKPILAYTSSVGEIGMIEEDFYRTGDNGAFQSLTPKFSSNSYVLRYVLIVLRKQFSSFNYATSMAKVIDIKMPLPVGDDGQPDWDYMERYIRVMEKLVITDVVKWKDRQITVTKQVADKSIA